MIVVGTAGHIDHGKSAIVKRLTGTDPDRLPEEKKRGMTIDLGFAFYKTTKNETIAFVDVPGHERFVKNMIAGAGGIDAVMLVVAADDGWMPQTEEHFQIVRLLGIKSGIVVINKIDLADGDRIKNLKAEIEHNIRGTFLENAPILGVSAATGENFEELKQLLNKLALDTAVRKDMGKARLYIDRVFVMQGIGAVATGTLRDGIVEVGQTVSIWPNMKKAKIRTLQSNSLDVDTANPGQRTAVSLTGVRKEDLERGGAIVAADDLQYFKKHSVLAIQVELLKNCSVKLTNRRRVLLLVGTTEIEGEIYLLNQTTIAAGASGNALVKLDSPVYALVGDRFVLRLPTPMVTLGGGIIIDHLDTVPRKSMLSQLEYLNSRNLFNPKQMIMSELQKQKVAEKAELLKYSVLSQSEIANYLDILVANGKIQTIGGHIFATDLMKKLSTAVFENVKSIFEKSGGLKSLTADEIGIGSNLDIVKTKIVLSYLVNQNKLSQSNDLFKLLGATEAIPDDIQKACDSILAEIKKSPYMPPSISELTSNGKKNKQAVGHLLSSGQVYKCSSKFLFTGRAWNDILTFIKATLNNKSELTVGELRDSFKFSRKFAIPILEETDRIKLTKRKGDVRIRGENFEK